MVSRLSVTFDSLQPRYFKIISCLGECMRAVIQSNLVMIPWIKNIINCVQFLFNAEVDPLIVITLTILTWIMRIVVNIIIIQIRQIIITIKTYYIIILTPKSSHLLIFNSFVELFEWVRTIRLPTPFPVFRFRL